MALPTTTDIATYLSQRFGITVTAGDASITQMLNAALADLETITGYSPFISDGSSSALVLDFPRLAPYMLVLPSPLLTLSSIVVAGTTFTENVDFTLEPVRRQGPKLRVAFYRTPPTWMRVVTVTGTWGYCTAANLPADLFEAIMQLAAGKILSAITAGEVTSAGESWTDGDVSKRNVGGSTGGMAGLESSAGGAGVIASAQKTIARYKNTAVYA